ncbi:MAG: dimethyl sulfoxide reductase anchor subunit, partial [Alphaproteobacteria bacterium]|nr:dimethyl sulfoxide reductase anchor subunit [Alphaproteobacteria bacterium]
MNPAYSVIFFTTASGAGYGLLALLGLIGALTGAPLPPLFAFVSIVLALALITAGLLSSTFHLGHPERAWRALSQWRTSWLSREGVAAILTYPPALLFGLVVSGLYDMPQAIAPLGLITALMAMITVFTTGKIYATLTTIRAWNQPLTVPVYLIFALATGASLALALLALFDYRVGVLSPFAMIALLLAALMKALYWRGIDRAPRDRTMASATGLGDGVRQWETPHTTKNFVQREMGFVVARRHAEKLRRIVLAL